MGHLFIKRIYEPADKADGVRILIDRLWPRGMKKERAQIDRWMKEVAPSTALRKQFHSNPEDWPKFQQDYIAELKKQESIKELVELIKEKEAITLLYAANNEQQNHALVLKQFLQGELKQ
jgi:uncharacterized protein YeaO (DUF488 family)